MSSTKFKIDGNSSFQILFMIVTESFSPFFLEFLSLFLISFLSLSLSLHTLCRCMITSGPHEFRTTASAPQPDAFSIEPNILRLLVCDSDSLFVASSLTGVEISTGEINSNSMSILASCRVLSVNFQVGGCKPR